MLLRISVKIIIFVMLVFGGMLPSFSEVDIVYPKKSGANIYAKSAFILGNIGEDNQLFINDKEVKIYNRGAFIYLTPLEYGQNNFELKSVNKDGVESIKTFVLNRPKPAENKGKVAKAEFELYPNHLFARVIQDNVPLRERADNSSRRLSHIDNQTFLIVDGQIGEYHRVFNGTDKPFWISKKFVKVSPEYISETAPVSHFNYARDRKNEYFYFKTDRKLPFVVKDGGGEIEVSLYYVDCVPDKLAKYVDNVHFKNNILSFKIKREKITGYNFDYDGANMVLKLKRPICANKSQPLKNIVVAVDAGHGGTEAGAIGFTRVREADIALDIAKKLECILKSEGAKVVMTRTENVNVDLYKRAEIIKVANPDFSISIHANALPDGANPLIKYGTSVFYYDKHSKEFAETLKNEMVKELNTRDDGAVYGNFVLTRIPQTTAILVEMAYMINPYDYEKLLDGDFRQKTAESIANGIKKYLTEN